MSDSIATITAALAAKGITAISVVEHDAVLTSEAQVEAMKGKIEGTFAKNLFMKDKKGKRFLIVFDANRKLDLKKVAKQLKASGNALRFEGAETLTKVMGVPEGSATPLAALNDSKNEVCIVFDQSFENADVPVLVHPLTNTATMAMKFIDIKTFVESTGSTVEMLDFDAELPKADEKPLLQPTKGGKKGGKGGKKKQSEGDDDADVKGITASKNDEFPIWFQQVVKRASLIEYYDISGCYILRPSAYRMWEILQRYFDDAIKELGVENCYFPLFVSKKALEAEASHIEGFSPEVAWVTKSGQSELPVPIAVRPTSETIIYPAYSKWINSYRDLPLKLNQWSNVVRWEFKHPTPFIRSREFLWQEGHSAFATVEEAEEEVLQILDLYASVYEDMMAVPVVKGKKTEEEKFAGALFTTTVEAFVPTVGRGIQGATSHCLGDGFAKMFNITFLNNKKEKKHPIQNSWGFTTRTIGVMVMVHGDDKGLVLPPRMAPMQVVIVPIFFKNSMDELTEHCLKLEKELKKAGIRVYADVRTNYNPGWKFNEYELKGVPLRLEVGPRDLKSNQVMACRRDKGEKFSISYDAKFTTCIASELTRMQNDMLQKATEERDNRMKQVTTWADFMTELNKRNIVLAPWCGHGSCENKIKKASGEEAQNVETHVDGEEEETEEEFEKLTGAAKSLCVPFKQPELIAGTKCVHCEKDAINWTLFGRSY